MNHIYMHAFFPSCLAYLPKYLHSHSFACSLILSISPMAFHLLFHMTSQSFTLTKSNRIDLTQSVSFSSCTTNKNRSGCGNVKLILILFVCHLRCRPPGSNLSRPQPRGSGRGARSRSGARTLRPSRMPFGRSEKGMSGEGFTKNNSGLSRGISLQGTVQRNRRPPPNVLNSRFAGWWSQNGRCTIA